MARSSIYYIKVKRERDPALKSTGEKTLAKSTLYFYLNLYVQGWLLTASIQTYYAFPGESASAGMLPAYLSWEMLS